MGIARDAISKQAILVPGQRRLADVASEIERVAATHCVVADGNSIRGVVRLRELATHSPLRIFADLVSPHLPPRVREDEVITAVAGLLRDPGTDCALVYDAADRFLGLVTKESILGALLDEQTRTGETLERTVAERTADLHKALQEMEIFSFALAHDLRAPLSRIRGFADMLFAGHAESLSEEARDYVERIASASKSVEELASEIQSLVHAAKEPVSIARVSLAEVVEDVMLHYHPFLVASGAKITVQPALPAVRAHYGSLFRVVGNLLHNSVKFTPHGVKARVSIRGESHEGRERLWVDDHGIGIAPEYHGKIFKPFTRLNQRSEYEGTGIGLAFSKIAVDRMGGRIGFESSGTGGCRFWIELERDTTAEPAADGAR